MAISSRHENLRVELRRGCRQLEEAITELDHVRRRLRKLSITATYEPGAADPGSETNNSLTSVLYKIGSIYDMLAARYTSLQTRQHSYPEFATPVHFERVKQALRESLKLFSHELSELNNTFFEHVWIIYDVVNQDSSIPEMLKRTDDVRDRRESVKKLLAQAFKDPRAPYSSESLVRLDERHEALCSLQARLDNIRELTSPIEVETNKSHSATEVRKFAEASPLGSGTQ